MPKLATKASIAPHAVPAPRAHPQRRVKDAGNLKVSQAQVLEDEGGDKGGKAKATLKKGQGKAK